MIDAPSQHGAHDVHAAGPPSGLSISEGGYALALAERMPALGRPAPFRFQILNERGEAERGFDRQHDREMHLIVVRRDLSGFQHLHPERGADGTWEAQLEVQEAGVYRAFADFSIAGKALTLGADLFVSGEFRPQPLPEPSPRSHADDGYQVVLREAKGGSALEFEVHREDRLVRDLEPYLGARGHLVALREGDLAFLHVHPRDAAVDGDAVTFDAHFPSAGRYRLFLQFQHEGQVRTAAFTKIV